MGNVVPLFRSRSDSEPATYTGTDSRTEAALRGQAEAWYQLGCEIEERTKAPDEAPDNAVDQAMAAYGRALACDPEHAGAHVNLGRLLHEAGDVQAAQAHYEEAVRIAPEEPVYWFNLGVALEDLERAAEAAAAYRLALTLDPLCEDAHFNLAGVLERTGDQMGALRHLSAYWRLRCQTA